MQSIDTDGTLPAFMGYTYLFLNELIVCFSLVLAGVHGVDQSAHLRTPISLFRHAFLASVRVYTISIPSLIRVNMPVCVFHGQDLLLTFKKTKQEYFNDQVTFKKQ